MALLSGIASTMEWRPPAHKLTTRHLLGPPAHPEPQSPVSSVQQEPHAYPTDGWTTTGHGTAS